MPLLNVGPAFPFANDMNIAGVGPGEELGSPEFWWKMFISTFLVLLGGVFAGYVPSRKKPVSLTPVVPPSCQPHPRTHGP